MKDLKSELSGDFRELTLALYTPAPVYDAKCLHDAMKGLGTKESVIFLIYIACARVLSRNKNRV